MKRILFNTLKITFASLIAIFIAKVFQLEFYISAGIVTILTIQNTKKETIKTALERFIALLIALFISYFCFITIGFDEKGFGVYLIIYIFICQSFKWYSSMAMNSVLISHFLTFHDFTFNHINNELGLFIIGVGMGVIANLHLNQNIQYMRELKNQADEQIRYILMRMSKRILEEIENYDGHCFIKLNHLIVKAKAVNIENMENTLFTKNDDLKYIKMREHQSQVLQEMYKVIKNLDTTPVTAKRISDYLYKISVEYHEENDCLKLLKEFDEIDKKIKTKELPVNRKEFEDRARLFYLLQLIKEFLTIKKEYINQ